MEKQWEPWVGEVLRLERDPTNQEDINAVAIINASGIVYVSVSEEAYEQGNG